MNDVTGKRISRRCYTCRCFHPIASSRVCIIFFVCIAARENCWTLLLLHVRAMKIWRWRHTGTVSVTYGSNRLRCCRCSYRIGCRRYYEIGDLIKLPELHLTSLLTRRNQKSARRKPWFSALTSLPHSQKQISPNQTLARIVSLPARPNPTYSQILLQLPAAASLDVQ